MKKPTDRSASKVAAPPLAKVSLRSLMASPVRALRSDEPLAHADEVLREYTLSSLAVVDRAGAPVGVVSRTDLLRVGRASGRYGSRHPLLELPDVPVSEVMTPDVLALAPEASALDAARELVRLKIHRVFVREGGALVGVVSTRELTELAAQRRLGYPIADFMSTPVRTVHALDPAVRAVEKLADAQVSGLVVLDDDESPAGLFTQVEALQARAMPERTPVEDVMSYALLCLATTMPLHRAARYALATRARRVVAVDNRRAWGVLTGLDFVRALVASSEVDAA